ncbi:hypothetical protein, partial [Niallia taxi]
IMVLLLTLISPLHSVSASSNTELELPPVTMEKDYREMMNIIKKNVIAGQSEKEIANIPEVIEFQKKYTSEQINLYLNNKIEAFKSNNLDIKKNKLDSTIASSVIEVGKNEKQIIEYPDGSFSVFENVTELDNNTDVNPIIMPMASHSGKPGTKYTTTNTKEFWGFYLAARAVLITKYTVNKSSIKINDTDDAGSKSILPTTLTLRGTSIVTNNAKSVESKGNFMRTNGVVIGGQAIGFSSNFTLRTKIKITSSSSSKVNFTTTSTYEG